MRRVIVLHAPSPGTASADWERTLLHRLPYARRLELEARDQAARCVSLGGTALLFEAAERLGYREVSTGDLQYPQGAKPRVAGGPFFSISHTTHRVACAASRECDVGLDHEEFTGEDAPARLRHWTAVEATLKAAGEGLQRVAAVEVDPDLRFSSMGGARFHLMPLDFGPGVVACLASSVPPDAIDVQPLEGVEP
jgi:phosphopantetheinyl transferase